MKAIAVIAIAALIALGSAQTASKWVIQSFHPDANCSDVAVYGISRAMGCVNFLSTSEKHNCSSTTYDWAEWDELDCAGGSTPLGSENVGECWATTQSNIGSYMLSCVDAETTKTVIKCGPAVFEKITMFSTDATCAETNMWSTWGVARYFQLNYCLNATITGLDFNEPISDSTGFIPTTGWLRVDRDSSENEGLFNVFDTSGTCSGSPNNQKNYREADCLAPDSSFTGGSSAVKSFKVDHFCGAGSVAFAVGAAASVLLALF
jgi:hypothetical protein